ncbi:MAG: DNA sulfur modification protein DndD [Desulfobacterales bacterium]|nr:DNA sulfur modification protein DndD [Desulfobacterales bacterium]
MLLNKVILENFGLYSGKVEFDLTPRVKYRKERPVILFGGKNGAGKTTFLDAIRLVLYGMSILGDRISQERYEAFLRQQVHQSGNGLLSPEYAKVAIEFDYVFMGEKQSYYVERSWTLKKRKGVKEFLKIFVNGQALDDITPEYWKGFVEEIIPERLSQLFFFDGEKIKSIAEDKTGSYALVDSIKTLLGLDVVEKLKADLAIYSSREAKKLSTKRDQKDWNEIEMKIGNIEAELQILLEEHANIETKINGITADIRAREQRLHQEGHVFASKRDSLKNKKVAITAQIEKYKAQIKEECELTYPFSLCPSVSKALQEQISKEKEIVHWSAVRNEIEGLQDELLSAVSSSKLKLNNSSKQEVTSIIQSVIRPRVQPPAYQNNIQVIFGFSASESQQILEWLNDSDRRSLPRVKKVGQALERDIRDLRTTSKQLAKGPAEAQVQPIFEELSSLSQRMGDLHYKKKKNEEEVLKKKYDLMLLQRDQKKLIEKQMHEESIESRLSLVKTIQATLDTYLKRLTEKKIGQLSQAVVDCLNKLCRKDDIIHSIKIDPETFAVTYYDRFHQTIPKEGLSSGEKQLYAISVLWGLAKTSGRPLPVIVDTPLGRLDSDHRRNLIENYFPKASHQVILLSTDTEVDQELYEELSPNISHCYHLKYENETKRTVSIEEYFWKKRTCTN